MMKFILYYSINDRFEYDYILGSTLKEVFNNIGEFLEEKNAIFKHCERV